MEFNDFLLLIINGLVTSLQFIVTDFNILRIFNINIAIQQLNYFKIWSNKSEATTNPIKNEKNVWLFYKTQKSHRI